MADKILIVDDEKQVRDLLSEFLTGEGYETIVAVNGEEAIDLAEGEDPQLVLLDLKMPGLDGLEVSKRLRAKTNTRFVPIIMITALKESKTEAIRAGVDDFVNKPFDLEELSVRIKSILRIRYLNNELERALAYIEELGEDLPKL
jgi:DNA-binding response OmpR family regulator